MVAIPVTTDFTPCGSTLPDLEIPMISTMVSCLGSGHRKVNDLVMQLAFAATRCTGDRDAAAASRRAFEAWDELRHDLWPHLLIEDELVFSWGEAHHAFSAGLLESLKVERQEMRKLVAALPDSARDADREPQTPADRRNFAQMLLALARALDSHVERYDGEVLPSILRALFRRDKAGELKE